MLGATASHTIKSRLPIFSLLTGALMISFSGVWVEICHVPPTVSAFYRVFFGGLILLPAVLWHREAHWYGPRHSFLILLCGLFFALDLVFYHHSIQYIGPGLGTLIPNFQVFILTGVGIVFLGERLRWIFFLSVPLAIAGLMMIVGVDWHALDPQYRKGIYFGLGAACCYAGFLLSLRRLQSAMDANAFFYVLMMVSFTTAGFLGLEVIRLQQSFRIPDLQSALALVALGLFSQAVGWIIITNALPRVRASLSGLILLLQPALAFVWDVLFFQRPTDTRNWLGLAIVLLAIYLGARRAKSTQ
jgi:drug/metabolite transporter (DMT)-like permease